MRLINANQRTGGDHGLDTKSRAVIGEHPLRCQMGWDNAASHSPTGSRILQAFKLALRSSLSCLKHTTSITATGRLYGLENCRSRPVPSPKAPIFSNPIPGQDFLEKIIILRKRACYIQSRLTLRYGCFEIQLLICVIYRYSAQRVLIHTVPSTSLSITATPLPSCALSQHHPAPHLASMLRCPPASFNQPY